MENNFKQNKYAIVKQFFTPQECEEMYSIYRKYCADMKFEPKRVAESTFNAYQEHTHVIFLEKLCMIIPKVVEVVGDNVLPTYGLGRFYAKGGKLTRHVDRPACEVSLTVNLAQDKQWSIWIEPFPDQSPVEVIQEPGDALFYSGHTSPHWRYEYDGEEYCQVFFHYVRSRGKFAQHYFDRSCMSFHNHDKDIKGLN